MIAAAAPPDLIRAAFPALLVTADAGRRIVSGVAVPYGVEGVVADGTHVVFESGALDDTRRPVALRDHDRTRPIGVVVAAHTAADRLHASMRISAVAEGDDALVLAADGALGMFSVGVEPTVFHYDAAGVLHVTAGDWQELSLLTLGAFTEARVSSVTATKGPTMPDIATVDTDTEPDDATDAEQEDDEQEEAAAPDVVEAAARPVPVTAARGGRRRRPEDVNLHQLSALLCASRVGNVQAQRLVRTALAAQGNIDAALVDITIGADIGAAFRPAYQAELIEIVAWGTPLIDALRPGTLERGDYPNKTFNKWNPPPTVALQTGEKVAIASTPAKITPTSVPVETWAGGNDISQQTLDLGSPSFVEDYIRAATIDYATKSDTYAVATLLAAATAVPTLAADSFISIVASLVGALSPATTPPGGLFLAMSYDVGVGLIGVPRDAGPAFWDGNVGFGQFLPTTTMGGLSAFVDPNMPANTYLLGHRQGATWYAVPGVPFNLRAINVANLGLDIAVYGYGALGVQFPGAFVKTTPAGP